MEINSLWNAAGAASALCAIPGTLELSLLTAGAMWPNRKATGQESEPAGRLAVVIPAHNEEASIGACLKSVLACEGAPELAEVHVVADNCSDATAAVARRHGVAVFERHDQERRGKGHALQYAFDRLIDRGFAAFLVIDADTHVEPNLLRECATAFARGAEAVQCPYLVSNPGGSRSTIQLDLALRAFNLVRPKGRWRLGLSAGILGNGFGVSRAVVERVPYTAHSVVEDLEYHLALVSARIRVEFLASTAVYGVMPEGGTGRSTQRARWEGGRLRLFRERSIWLAGQVARGRARFIEPLLDLLLLPLAFHTLLLTVAASSPFWPVRAAGLAGLGVLAAHLAAAVAHGSNWRQDCKALVQAPLYVCWKLLRLPQTIAASGRGAAWVRTARQTEERAA